jgi:uncharacterized protein (DUF58 family)
MFDIIQQDNASTQTHEASLEALRDFVGAHRDALLHAASLLGGGPGLQVARAVLDGLKGPGTPTRRTMRQLGRLLDLLKLENAHREGTIEAELFSLIDPTDPCVEQICFLADQLADRVTVCRAAWTPADVGERAAA